MEFSNLKKYIFHFQGGYRVAMKAAPEQLAEGLSRGFKWINTIDDDGNLERSVALQHVLSIESEEAAEEGTPFDDLPDEWVDAKKLREVIDKLRDDGHYASENLADELEAILPTPPAPRTLADMAPVERAECDWMQCDHPALEEPGVILQIWGNGCHVLPRDGVVETEALNHVAPRPDLPRMQWPGNEPEEEVIIDSRDLLQSRQYLDSDGCVWGFRTCEGEDGPHWHWRLEGSSAWESFWFSAPIDGPWTEYKGQD